MKGLVSRIASAGLAAFCLASCHAANAPLPPPPGAPAESFEAGTLHVDRYGKSGSAVILIPGLAAGPWEWYGLIARLAPAHRVYALTLPGFDGREPSATPGDVISTTEKSLLELVAHEHLRKPVLIGHDLGAAIALAFAESDPDVPGSIVAVDGVPVSRQLAGLGETELRRQADSAAAAETRDPEMIRPMALQNAATLGAIDTRTTEAVLDRQESADNTALAIGMREMLATDLRPELNRISAPLLVLVPYNLPDNSTPPNVQPPIVYTQVQKITDYRALYAGARTATFVPIAPARHFLMLDAPAATEAAIESFLAAHP